MRDFSRNAARYFAAAAATLFLISCGGSDDTPAPPPFAQTVVVLGASGADIGNRCGSAADPLCFPVPPYAGPSIAANGKLYPQLVAAAYGAPLVASSAGGTDFAIGGATTGVIPTDTVPQKLPNMQLQLEQYLQRSGFLVNPQTPGHPRRDDFREQHSAGSGTASGQSGGGGNSADGGSNASGDRYRRNP